MSLDPFSRYGPTVEDRDGDGGSEDSDTAEGHFGQINFRIMHHNCGLPWGRNKNCSESCAKGDIRERGRPYDLVPAAGRWKHLTRSAYADIIRAVVGSREQTVGLMQSEVLVLMCIAYFQPITRAELSGFFDKEVSSDLIGHLHGAGLIASGRRSPTPGAPYTYVTTKECLLEFGFSTLRDQPDSEELEDAGLLSKEKLLAGDTVPYFSQP